MKSLLRSVRVRLVPVLACLAALAIIATGCVSKPTTTSTTPPPTGGGQGVLNLYDTGPYTLDPALAADVTSASYVIQIFSGLARTDGMLKVVPDIATGWDISADNRTYTFHLRQDARFHDGRQVKAADFIYSWERALTPGTGSQTASTFLIDIVGAVDMLSGKAAHLAGAKALNDFTIQVTIDAPRAYFLNKIASPCAFVVDKSNVTSANWWQHPNGTGPFRLQQYQAATRVVLDRNADYYGEKAKLAQVIFQLFAGNPLDLYQEGTIDVANVNPAYMGLVTDPANSISKELHQFDELSLFYIGFNSAEPPFDDPAIRQAFTHAVDRDRVMALATQGVYPAAYGILPEGMPGYDPSLQGLRFDPAKAKALIASSKYGDVSKLPPIVWTTAGWGNDISGVVGGVINEWRRNLGVEVTVRQLEPEPFLYLTKQEKDQVFDSGWIADYPDPQDFLELLFRTGVQNNSGEYSNPALDALLSQAGVEPEVTTRLSLYRQAERMIVQDAAMLPLYFGHTFMLVKPYVKDYALSPMGYPLLTQVSIQK